MRMRHGLALLLLGCATAVQAQLPPAVLHALKSADIPAAAVAVVVQPVEAGQPRVSHRADVPMNPASLMKLLTTLAALERLGPAHTWRTEALAERSPDADGVLAGDLILRGGGDPKLTHERLWLLLRELRGRGLREIRGDLVLDRSAFAAIEHDPAAFDGRPQRPYNVGADALLFNFATLHLTLIPDGRSVRVLTEPQPAGLDVHNRLRLVEGKPCGAWREALAARFSPAELVLEGDFPRSCGEKRWHLAGLPNAQLLHGVFARYWRELGGSFSGRVREGSTPENAVTLAVAESPPLAEIVRDINKFSNNVMAWQLFLTLGANGTAALAVSPPARAGLGVGGQKVGAGETATADRQIRQWLAGKGLDFPELAIDNGSGLSRTNRIAAASLARLLAAGWASPVMPELIASLPVAGIDGTTRKRFNGNGVAGRAHLKTGSLEGVRGIAGYLLDRQGRRHIVVFMVNHPNAAQAQAAFDALLDGVWQGRP